MTTTIIHGLSIRAKEFVESNLDLIGEPFVDEFGNGHCAPPHVTPVGKINSPLGNTGEWLLKYHLISGVSVEEFVQVQFFDAQKDYHIYLGLRHPNGNILEPHLWSCKEMGLIKSKG